MEVLKRRRTDGILRGEFTEPREPLDLAEEQWGYGSIMQAEAGRATQAVDQEPTWTVGFTLGSSFREFVDQKTETSAFGFAKLRSPKPRQEAEGYTGHTLGHVVESQHFDISGLEGSRASQGRGPSNPRNVKRSLEFETSELGESAFALTRSGTPFTLRFPKPRNSELTHRGIGNREIGVRDIEGCRDRESRTPDTQKSEVTRTSISRGGDRWQEAHVSRKGWLR
jgi:hypothetical protein